MESKEDIVIAGISGRFPECNNVEEFREALLQGKDLLTADDRRFPAGIKNLPKRSGKILDIDKFDATFFGLHPKQANFTDPRHRILLETVYEAIVDAGYNPDELRGSNTGVYIGLSLFTNFNEMISEDTNGYSILGSSLCSAANRISFCFDFTGPSYSLDTGCSGSLYAFTHAVDHLRSGEIEYAIVGGTHIGLSATESEQYNNLNMLSPDGMCKVFSKNRNGFARSEAICAYFLQKAKGSRRIYATVVGAKANTNGYNEDGYTFPSVEGQYRLLKELYTESKVSIDDVVYVELHGTGSKVGDIVECQSLVNMFGKNRKEPLLIGSVKSNMGHGEPTAGLAGITKVIIAMESGIIPANLHYDPIDETLPGLKEKRLKVVTSNTQYKEGIVGINAFGFGGANSHILLKPHTTYKSTSTVATPKPYRLVHVSGTTHEAVEYYLAKLNKNRSDEELLCLVDEIHKRNIQGHNYRGYAVLGDHSIQEIKKYKLEKRPIWFVYSGMGAHWPGMGKDLMHIEVFRTTINRCAQALKPYGVDLIDVIMSGSPSALENLGNCFSAIISISIALTDLLANLGIVPDYFIGHSLGEVGCAYANGDLTPEQAIMLAFAKYYACTKTKLPTGQMAVIGMSKHAVQKILPEDIFIACHNGKESVTITGPAESTKELVNKLQDKGIFARVVYTGNIAFHSKYLLDAPKHFKNFMEPILSNPKPRSKKWISSSVPDGKENETWANTNCAEYHTNNFLNRVCFDRVFEKVEPNAIVIEIGPHGIMQAVLKKELGPNNSLFSLLDKNLGNQEACLLSSIGKIFNAGVNPNLRKLYNGTTFPVKAGTKMIAPLVKWDHSVSWFVPYWKNNQSLGYLVTVNLNDAKYSYLKGHNIDGKIVMPAAAYLEMVWQAKANICLKEITELSVLLKNIKFHNMITLQDNENVEFVVTIIKESGNFEIFSGDLLVATGNICVLEKGGENPKSFIKEINKQDTINLRKEDFYREAHLRRHLYYGKFQGIVECDLSGVQGKIEWMDNYVSFIDSMFQLSLLSECTRNLSIPTSIRRIELNPKLHIRDSNNKYLEVTRDPDLCITKCGGIEIQGLKFTQLPRKSIPDSNLLLEKFEFVAYDASQNKYYTLYNSLVIAMQIIKQNSNGLIKKLTIGELKDTEDSNLELTEKIKAVLKNQVMADIEFLITTPTQIKTMNAKFESIIVTIEMFEKIHSNILTKYIRDDGFILCIGSIKRENLFQHEIIFRTEHLCLVRRRKDFPSSYNTLNIRTDDFGWLNKLKKFIANKQQKTIFIFSQQEDHSGIIGLQKSLLAEVTIPEFKAVFTDKGADIFSVDDEFYRDQLLKGLAYNVLRNNKWGTYVHLPLEEIKLMRMENAEIRSRSSNTSTLLWMEKPIINLPKEQTMHIINIYYSTFNYKHVMQYSPYTFGYAGTKPNGTRVMGIASKERISIQIKNDVDFTWEVPKCWTLKQAATIPLHYITAYYVLMEKGKIGKNNSLLLQDGASGIGSAVIAIALSFRAIIFISVNSEEEKCTLIQLYPLLDPTKIATSSEAIQDIVLEQTKGRGVDLVINPVGGIFIENSLNCLTKQGKFIQLTNQNNFDEIKLDSNMMQKNFNIYCIDLNSIFEEDLYIKQKLKKLLEEGITYYKVVKPLPSLVFNATEIETGIDYSEKSKETVLIKLRGETSSKKEKLSVHPKVFFKPNKTYIIVGGLGGIGLELTSWLIKNGATKIVLNGRRDVWNGYQALCFKNWSQIKDVIVQVDLNDTTTIVGAENLVNAAYKLGPVGGVFNAAIVLQDANITDQTQEKFEAVFKPKYISGRNMDTVTRKFCPQLDHFVVFSTVFAGRGNIGQTNYAMANSALERMCEKRRSECLPGLAIQWGPMEVGFLATTDVEQKNLLNLVPQQINSCLDTLERFMIQNVVVGSSLILAEASKLEGGKTTQKTLSGSIADILGITDIDSINKDLSLSRLGLDSLMLAEVKHTLYRYFELDMGTEEIRGLTFNDLINLHTDRDKSKTYVKSKDFPPPLLSKQPITQIKEVKGSSKTIFIIHPIEGYIHYLKPLANLLNATIFGVECTRESNFSTINENAQYFLKYIKEIQQRGPYYLCGYSYGVSLGLEIGLQLEKGGETVQLLAIDGAPDYSRKIFSNCGDLQQKICRLFPSLFKNVNLDTVKEIMEKFQKSEEYLPLIFKLISDESGIGLEDVEYSGRHYLSRCHASFVYYPDDIFKGKLKLVRRIINLQDESEDYQLQKYCQQTVEIEKLNGDHLTILFGENLTILAKIVSDWFNI
ncbi:fatty acid synthase-like [Diabrotica virgifera virgifera]|uniref:Fatty acid synthase n=1 Tax=Diabrotica virgifera virgifera TaxID=50390 RepID=A0ABM5IT20_DIAVI|nr:fatty acid synthase-like [Diabrotica virgifera virgifera]